MYKIIGADQKEYGPISAEQLRQWIAEGRANARTVVSCDGGPSQPLDSFPEFAGLTPLDAPAPPAAGAASAVKTPAVLIIIAGSLGMAFSLSGILSTLTGLGTSSLSHLPPEVPPEMLRLLTVAVGIPANLVGLAFGLLLVWGGVSMLKLQRWGLAIVVSIVAIICGNPCCCPIGLIAGIWGLVLLTKPEIKSAFH